jgi:hypothetical protein
MSLLTLTLVVGCAALKTTPSSRLDQQIAQADTAYRHLDIDHTSVYNDAVTSITRRIDGETPNELRLQFQCVGVRLDEPQIKLPLARYHLASESRIPNEPNALGVPMLLDYDTANAPLYPRDGLMVPATAVYRRIRDTPHLSLLMGKNSIELNGATYSVKIDNVAPVTERHVVVDTSRALAFVTCSARGAWWRARESI